MANSNQQSSSSSSGLPFEEFTEEIVETSSIKIDNPLNYHEFEVTFAKKNNDAWRAYCVCGQVMLQLANKFVCNGINNPDPSGKLKRCNFMISLEAFKFLVIHHVNYGQEDELKLMITLCKYPKLLANGVNGKCWGCSITMSTNPVWPGLFMRPQSTCFCSGDKRTWMACQLEDIKNQHLNVARMNDTRERELSKRRGKGKAVQETATVIGETISEFSPEKEGSN